MEWINPHSWIHIDVKTRRRQGREVDGRGRRAERAAAPRVEQELAAAGHRNPRRGLPGQGRRARAPTAATSPSRTARSCSSARRASARRTSVRTSRVPRSRSRSLRSGTVRSPDLRVPKSRRAAHQRRAERDLGFSMYACHAAMPCMTRCLTSARSRVGRPLAHRAVADRRDDGRLLRLHPAGGLQQAAARHALLAPGLSLGMLLGALVIVVAWVLTWIYVRWANTPLRRRARGAAAMIGGSGEPNVIAIGFFLGFIVAVARHHGVGVAARRARPSTSTPRAAASPRCRTAWRWPATT